MDHGLAHVAQHRPGALDRVRLAAHHKGKRARRSPGDAAGDRRIQQRPTAFGRRRRDGARGVHVDGRAVDQQRARRRGRENPALAAIDLRDMRAGGQHGDDRLPPGGSVCDRGRRRRTGPARLLQRLRVDVEGADGMAGRRQIGGHRPPHVAESDEADVRHVGVPLPLPSFVAPFPAA